MPTEKQSIHVQEFLYRGRAPDEKQSPAWHVVLATTTKDTFDQVVKHHKTFNMAQAAKQGFALPEIIKAINADTLKHCEQLQAELEQATAKIEAQAGDLSAAESMIKNMAEAADQLVAAHKELQAAHAVATDQLKTITSNEQETKP